MTRYITDPQARVPHGVPHNPGKTDRYSAHPLQRDVPPPNRIQLSRASRRCRGGKVSGGGWTLFLNLWRDASRILKMRVPECLPHNPAKTSST